MFAPRKKSVKLKESDLDNLHDSAVKGMTSKFQLTLLNDNIKQLDVIYSLAMRVIDLHRHMAKYDMLDAMMVITPNLKDIENPLCKDIENHLCIKDLLDGYGKISQAKVQDNVRFLKTYGQDYDCENIEWVQELLENSCEPTLSEKVLEQILGIPQVKMGGPTCFSIMMRVITTISEDGIRTLVDKTWNMKISSIVGENVAHAISFLRGAIACLQNLKKQASN